MSAGKIILFQGDSITDAGRSKGGEGHQYLGYGYVNQIAGRLGLQYAEAGHRFINRGISGNRVSDLYARWNEDAISLQPHVISFLIGVNDAWRIARGLPDGATDRFERAYRHLLEETAEVLPGAGLVLCEPFVLTGSVTEANWESFKHRMEGYGQVVRTLAEEYDGVFVALQQPFDQAVHMCRGGLLAA
jgi:lysophospholipase L1-like esterase